ncbi:hypothetical protein PTKIN_Ptkin09bG0171200 [Pterospermum kingtungense]
MVGIGRTSSNSARAQVMAKPDCPAYCGNLSIPYPFGVKEGCFLNENFRIDCNDSDNSSTAFLPYTDFLVTNISMEGRLQAMATVARDCYKASGKRVNPLVPFFYRSAIFNVSNTRNKFTAIGCDTYAYLNGNIGNKSYTAGCMSICDRIDDVVNGSCSGFGCCQIQIPDGLNVFDVVAYSFENHSKVSDFNLCSYAFVVEESQFEFSSDYVRSIPEDHRFPLSLDWIVGNQMCEDAKKNGVNFTCRRSECYEPETGMGYLCKCSDGYEGNPYLPEGCLGMISMSARFRVPVTKMQSATIHQGVSNVFVEVDTKAMAKKWNWLQSSVSISVLAVLLFLSWLYWGLWQRKQIKQRDKFFQQNGGLILQQELSKHKGPVAAKIFTALELKNATNNYHESRILGRGGHGTVYKGILQDNRVVAIKKSMIADHSQVEQFINEVIVLSQVNHRNVVKLLGCCLETEVPLDVKSTNILLDEHYTAKVSDFGASRLVPLDRTQLTTLVQGTLGYLDPEYFQSSKLTEKSDVYSFGVVLVELLTGRKALCFQIPEEERNLAMHFVSALKENLLFRIIDHNVLLEENIEQIKEVAKLAKRCLRVRGEERPSMKEVAMELEGLRAMAKHPWIKDDANSKETENLLGNLSGIDSNPSGYDSNRQQIILHGR